MKGLNILARGLGLYCVATVFIWLVCGVPKADAISQDITAVFRYDPSNPSQNKFTLTTPVSGYCARFPSSCAAAGMSSLQLPLRFISSTAIEANHADTRQGAMFKVPANWRTVQVVNSRTNESEEVEVRVAGMGTVYRLGKTHQELVGGAVNNWQAHTKLWGSGWWHIPGCVQTQGTVDAYSYTYFWKVAQETVCQRQAKYRIPSMAYDYLDFAYELRLPNPLKMSAGHYKGTLNYHIGPGQDFDMGDVMRTDHSAITLNFDLEVQHLFKIEIPLGGHRVVLEPQGGWQAWLSRGRQPTRLFREQTFHISTSSPFKMELECEHAEGGVGCGVLERDSGHIVPVTVSVSLPPGFTDATGQRVNRRRLYHQGTGTDQFKPDGHMERKPGTLHFEIARNHVEEMLKGGGRTYTGNVTVIWDSEI